MDSFEDIEAITVNINWQLSVAIPWSLPIVQTLSPERGRRQAPCDFHDQMGCKGN